MQLMKNFQAGMLSNLSCLFTLLALTNMCRVYWTAATHFFDCESVRAISNGAFQTKGVRVTRS